MMSETKFTPGPWELYNGKDHNIVQRGESGGFGVVDTDKIRMDADSNLIAAAPDLYDELEKALKNWIELIESGDAGFWDPERDKHVISMRKVLSKARGET